MNKLNNMRIKEKLVRSYFYVILITGIAALVGVVAMVIMTTQYNNVLNKNGFSQGDIGKTMTTFAETRSSLRAVIGYDKASDIEKVQSAYYEAKDNFQTYLDVVEGTIATSEEKATWQKLMDDMDGYWELSDEILEQGATTDIIISEQAQSRAINELTPRYEVIYDDMKTLMDINVTTGDSVNRSLLILEKILIAVIVAVIALGVYFSLVIGKRIAKDIAGPLGEMSERLKSFSEGDLDSEFPVCKSKDEVFDMVESAKAMSDTLNAIITDINDLLGKMADGNFDIHTSVEEKYIGKFETLLLSIRQMNRKIDESLRHVEETAEQVSLGSENMAEAAQSLAEGATEQAGAVEELQATIADITATVERTAVNLQTSYDNAKKYAADADYGRTQMQEMVSAMERISETSMKIENIISELEDIASQTNLLSLNASIEAARAGEAGKGFAVVADQIRKLAEQSGNSAVTTRQLIEGSIHEVEEGNKAVKAVFATLDDVIRGINEIADTSRGLSEDSTAQAEAMEQAEKGVNQISEVVQSNSAMAEETSATSEELSAQAETLDSLVKQFTLRQR